MGQVYLAEHALLERKFALKVLRRDMIEDQTAVERFRREARAASRMQHRNIVYISDFGQLPDGRLYLVMEYIPGDGLEVVVARERRLAPHRAARILLQVADALDYAHDQGVVHRDLKSENILLTVDRHRRDVAKILDFGLAKILGGAGSIETLTTRGQIFGTPEYMSPEQILGENIDGRTDIYAVGVLTFELLTGRPPFTGSLMELLVAHRKLEPPVPSDVSPDAEIPRIFDEIVSRCMKKEPAQRFQKASEIVGLLQAFLRNAKEDATLQTFDGVLSTSGPPPAPPPAAKDPAFFASTAQTDPSFPETPIVEPLGHRAPSESDFDEADTSTFSEDAVQAASDDRLELRKQYRRILQEIAQLLRDRDLGTAELTVELTKSFELEEKVFEQETELALLESRLEEIESSGRERESRLRYAIIDLGMERSKLAESPALNPPDQSMLADLTYQIGELERRLLDVSREREANLTDIENQMAGHRRTLDDLRAALARQDNRLLELILSLQSEISQSETLRQAYGELNQIRAQLSS